MPDITIVIVDDHRRVHQIVETVLRMAGDIRIVGQAGNGVEALDLVERLTPDIVLMDVVMPVMDGVEATRAILERAQGVKVLVLSSFHDHESVYAMLEGGAAGYVTKEAITSDLIDTIRAVHAGKSVFSSEVTRLLLDDAEPASSFDLTDRELEVLGLMAEGLTNQQIAHELSISTSTVKFHVANVVRKIGVATRSEALVAATKANLI